MGNREIKRRVSTLVVVICLASAISENRVTVALDFQQPISQYLHAVWTTEQGLPQNSVTAITQTRDGYLWVGTFGGLARFDGVRFTIFDTANAPGLKSNRILALYEDREGTLWIGTEYGGLTRYAQGRFTSYTTEDGLPDNLVDRIGEDRQGNLWASTARGLARFRQGRLTSDKTYFGLENTQRLRFLLEAQDGSVWVETPSGLARSQAGMVTSYTTINGQPINWLSVIAEGQAGGVWIHTNAGLARFSGGTLTLVQTDESEIRSPLRGKSEIRNPKSETNPKFKTQMFRMAIFVLRISRRSRVIFVLRVSPKGLRSSRCFGLGVGATSFSRSVGWLRSRTGNSSPR